MGFEPTTTTLATWRSTPELLPLSPNRPRRNREQDPSPRAFVMAEANLSIDLPRRIASPLLFPRGRSVLQAGMDRSGVSCVSVATPKPAALDRKGARPTVSSDLTRLCCPGPPGSTVSTGFYGGFMEIWV